MGTDIHWVLERNINGKWLGILPDNHTLKAKRRNYIAFAELASLRGESSKNRVANGAPDDASELSLYLIKQWEGDGHSHSHLSLDEFCSAFIDADNIAKAAGHPFQVISDNHKDDPWVELFGIEFDEGSRAGESSEYRVVFWFDN